MPDIAYEDLLPQVQPECRQCPEPVILNAIREVARDFCRRTTYWRADHADITTVTDESAAGQYTLTIPSGAAIESVIDPVIHNNFPVYRKTKNWLDSNVSNWRTKTGTQASYYRMITANSLQLIPYPTTAQTSALKVSMVLKPSRTSTGIPDTVFEPWYEILAHGAKAMILSMEDEEWFKPKRAAQCGGMYEAGLSEAKSQAIAEFNNNRVDRKHRVSGHYF